MADEEKIGSADEDVELHADEIAADEVLRSEDKPEDRSGDDFQLHADEAL